VCSSAPHHCAACVDCVTVESGVGCGGVANLVIELPNVHRGVLVPLFASRHPLAHTRAHTQMKTHTQHAPVFKFFLAVYNFLNFRPVINSKKPRNPETQTKQGAKFKGDAGRCCWTTSGVRHPLFARGHPCAALVAFLVLAFKRYQGVIILIEGCPNCAYMASTLFNSCFVQCGRRTCVTASRQCSGDGRGQRH
jgi:hypothetical protein